MNFVTDKDILNKSEAEICDYLAALKTFKLRDDISVAQARKATEHLDDISKKFKTMSNDKEHVADLMAKLRMYYQIDDNDSELIAKHTDDSIISGYFQEIDTYIRALNLITRDKTAAKTAEDIPIYEMLYNNTKKACDTSITLARDEIRKLTDIFIANSNKCLEYQAAVNYLKSPLTCKHVIELKGIINPWERDDPSFTPDRYNLHCIKCRNTNGDTKSENFGTTTSIIYNSIPESIEYNDFGAWICHGIKNINKYRDVIHDIDAKIKRQFAKNVVENFANQSQILELHDPVIESYKLRLAELLEQYAAAQHNTLL